MAQGLVVQEINVKDIVIKSKLPDTDYVVNPYIGCQHGCVYCYADFMKRITHHQEPWGKFVDVKINAIDVLKTGKYRGKRLLFSSVTDPYQPLEAKYKLTRRLLEALVDDQPKIEILTKSRLVLRDIDILKKFDDATVGVSIATLNEAYSRQVEPLAALPRLRIDTVKKCKEAGLRTYIFLSPIFPYITDVGEIVGQTASYADFFMAENLNLNLGNLYKIQGFLEKNTPELIPRYIEIYGCKGLHPYWRTVEEALRTECGKHKKEIRIYFHHGRPQSAT